MASAPKNAPAAEKRKSLVLGIICLLITVAILIAGLWPFNIHPLNKVEWLQDGKGIRFYGQGIVFSPEPLLIQHTISGNAAVTIEFLVRPNREITNGVPSILTLYDRNKEQFIIGQWKTQLIIRVPAAKADSHKRYREIGLANVLKKDTSHLITVTSGKEATAVYVDGMLKKSAPHYSLINADGGFSGYLVLGNSPEGTQSWNGSFLGLAIYDRILTEKEALDHYDAWQKLGQPLASDGHASVQADRPTSLRAAKPIALYLFDEHNNDKIRDQTAHNDLLIPATFKPLCRTSLGMPERDQWFSRANLKDVSINIIGFVPWGFFFSAWLRRVKNLPAPCVYGVTLLIGICLSLAIELVQVYLPARDSSLMDVFSNILGTVLGVFIFKYALPVFHKVKSDSQLIL